METPPEPALAEAAEAKREAEAQKRLAEYRDKLSKAEDELDVKPSESGEEKVAESRQAVAAAEEEAGGEDGRVEITVAEEDSRIVLEVLDRGTGIPTEVLPQIFDPFFTTKDAVTGVGLGLSVAQGIVRRHGGRIEGSNRPGGGARFRVEVPVAR